MANSHLHFHNISKAQKASIPLRKYGKGPFIIRDMKNTLSKENQNSNAKVEQLSSLLLPYN